MRLRQSNRFLAGLLLSLSGVAIADPADDSTTVQEVTVIAKKLDEARDTIQPQLGASAYKIDAQALQAIPGAENTGLNQVVLQAPGVAQDSYGQLHVRGEHNGLQFRFNGVILPEGLSVFGQALSPRLADSVTLITGALPAQYGLRTAGIIDVKTKSGAFFDGGSLSVYGGSRSSMQPSFEYGGNSGSNNYYFSGSYQRNNLGIESPDGSSTPLHDRTEQVQGFGYFEHVMDSDSRLSLILGTSNNRFEIPNSAGLQPDAGLVVNGQSAFASELINERQREQTHYAVASYLATNEQFTSQLSVFGRYSSLKFQPDLLADLLYTGIAQTAAKKDAAGGVQAEGVYHLSQAHTLRGGLIVQIDRASSNTSSRVLPLDEDGAQTTDQPINIQDDGFRTSRSYSVYAQDEWALRPNLTLNYGLRFDQFNGFRSENQVSPRANLVWLPIEGTTVHAGFARYFSPPPFELVASTSVTKFDNTTAAGSSDLSTTPYAERNNYYDVGVSQKLSSAVTIAIDTYYSKSKRLVDEGQFGAPIILTPFNYADGRQYGAEFTGSYQVHKLNAYLSFAYSKAQGRNIISSEFNFSPDDLAYIANHYIYLDHDQTYSASGGLSYLWRGMRFAGNFIYGSGLRADGEVPNGRKLPSYTQVNLGISRAFQNIPTGPYEIRLDAINVFDRKYQIRDGSGIGVGAPQYGARRGVFAGFTKRF